MSIFSRMADIINSNLNAMLDKAEDPQKMIRLIIQEMEETLVEVRSSSARVIADKKTAERRLERVQAELGDWEAKAKLAISKGREDLARAALAEKQAIAEEITAVEQELSALDDHLAHLNDEISQLQQKLNDAKAKQKAMLMRVKTVSSRLKVKRQVHREALDDAFSKFEHFERRMDHLEGQVDAMDLGRDGKQGLATEIEDLVNDEKVNDELARLKAEMSGKDAGKDGDGKA
ncbi:phage shock protein PspA [Exilibacterium tricleocarpae]|uniref:Phage shock protein PspA n=1 Tax=Exilibacterium tricleocarpae TaxID=2591008 RepID=A0A545SSM0_9GAMM|nr:phage shock protein PspA [Exilibacterium tricleocarpae]TQV67971.1 phage shock protein PspA [Exilibacterium tricleocarpae]